MVEFNKKKKVTVGSQIKFKVVKYLLEYLLVLYSITNSYYGKVLKHRVKLIKIVISSTNNYG